MYTLLISVLIFLIGVFLHVLIYRIILTFGVRSFSSAAVFVLILAVYIILLFFTPQYLPVVEYKITSVMVYISLSVSYLALSASLILGDESPSSKIVLEVERHPGIKQNDLIKLFSDSKLVDKRLEDMLSSGMIAKHNQSYTILLRGRLLVFYVSSYHNLLGWKELG
ncbi:hypothetical protein A2154_01695 [Candidatus Gottesmanbacteria bacterium RBG_16_43_7]|uniref:Uncharacterized protein n=1 Tax=Candidatus Gottesmanbacteria bacterium RBG_16_43_7 TaxID=1798373 RepID=A0A1F5Z8I2_9BACT|nr:MAG: hypothetical protein A2154_01695 [Candidatus Gottesmanbacteria bacterium RBG_16_43_7]